MQPILSIRYLLDEEGRKASLLSGGDGKAVQIVRCNVTPTNIELAHVREDGDVSLDLTEHLPDDWYIGEDGEEPEDDSYQCIKHHTKVFTFSKPMTPGTLVQWEKKRRAKTTPDEETLKRCEASLQDYIDRQKDYEEGFLEFHAEEERARQAAFRAAEADRKKWIQDHGSDYVKRATNMGYDCARQYARERSELEFPEWYLDFDCKARWSKKACPSSEALDDAEEATSRGHKAVVIWLKDEVPTPAGVISGSREACLIYDYLSKYNLLKIYRT